MYDLGGIEYRPRGLVMFHFKGPVDNYDRVVLVFEVVLSCGHVREHVILPQTQPYTLRMRSLKCKAGCKGRKTLIATKRLYLEAWVTMRKRGYHGIVYEPRKRTESIFCGLKLRSGAQYKFVAANAGMTSPNPNAAQAWAVSLPTEVETSLEAFYAKPGLKRFLTELQEFHYPEETPTFSSSFPDDNETEKTLSMYSSRDARMTAEIYRRRAEEMELKAAQIEAFGDDSEYAVGSVIAWLRSFGGPINYNYVAIKADNGYWYVSGYQNTRMTWENLVEEHLIKAEDETGDPVWFATKWESLV